MIIIDFDDTLFDTQAFKQARLEAVQRLGVSEDEYWETYRQARNDANGAITYTNERHAEVLAQHGYQRDEVLQMLSETTGDQVKEFLFDDTLEFLANLKSLGQPMVLLSLGNPGFQKLKTKGTGVEDYFDQVIIVHDTKQHVLSELWPTIHDEVIWFINDKVEETKRLVKVFPKLKPILKINLENDLDEVVQAWPTFESLTEIYNYIKNYDQSAHN